MLRFIFGAFNGVFLFIGLAMLAVKLFALVDAAIRPSTAYAAIDSAKTTWLVLLGIALFFFGLGLFGLAALVVAIVYLVDTRPKLREVQGRRGRPSSGPYGPW